MFDQTKHVRPKFRRSIVHTFAWVAFVCLNCWGAKFSLIGIFFQKFDFIFLNFFFHCQNLKFFQDNCQILETLGILQHHQFQQLTLPKLQTRCYSKFHWCYWYVRTRFNVQCMKCQLVHTCDLSLTCHSGNKQFAAMYKIIR